MNKSTLFLVSAALCHLTASAAYSACTTLSIDVPVTSIIFGDIPTSSAVINVPALNINNDSSDCTEDFMVDVTTYSTRPNGTHGWRIGNFATDDVFQLCWQFKGNLSTKPLFDISAICSSLGWNRFDAIAASDQNGSSNAGFADDVSTGSVRNLWFQLTTPTETDINDEQTFYISITAAAQDTF